MRINKVEYTMTIQKETIDALEAIQSRIIRVPHNALFVQSAYNMYKDGLGEGGMALLIAYYSCVLEITPDELANIMIDLHNTLNMPFTLFELPLMIDNILAYLNPHTIN